MAFVRRFASLIFGLFLYALGVVLGLQANIGYAPWDVFHVGLTQHFSITVGTASILVGAILCLVVFVLGEKLGLGTLLNMLLIGTFIDLISSLHLIPKMQNFWLGALMMIVGLFIIAFGSFFYIRSGFGAGPRDSLMVTITRRTHWPVGVCRAIVEGSALVIGYFLGGMVGFGTLIAVVGISFCVQIVFALLHFKPDNVKHETLVDTYKNLFPSQTA